MPTPKVRTPGDTSKSKASLGLPMDHVITWVPFANSYEDNNILKALAKARETKVHAIGAIVLREWFEANRAELTTEADEFLVTTEKSVEDLQKELQRSINLSKRLEEMLAKKG